jgi:hypothetical protein
MVWLEQEKRAIGKWGQRDLIQSKQGLQGRLQGKVGTVMDPLKFGKWSRRKRDGNRS